jgi:crotonobetaine/carnitine-CoA ligase
MYKLELNDIADRHLGRILELQAQHNGATEFLINDEQRITYAEAEAVSNRLASGFQSLGIGKGDRVCFYMGNLPELVLMCLALNKLGAIWVPICTDYKGEWLSQTIQRSEPKLLVTDSEHAQRLADVLDDIPPLRMIVLGSSDSLPKAMNYRDLLNYPPFHADYSQHQYSDTCAILWTSGTTGRSKGVMQAHNNWIRSTLLGTYRMYHCVPGDIVYCALPLYNSGAWLTCILRALMTGIGCVVEQKFSASRFMERIKHFNATQTFAVGAMSVFLMNTPEQPDDADNPLREACLAPIPPDKWQDFQRRFGVRLLRSGMGQSECLLTLNQEHCDRSIEIPVYALGYAPPDADVRLFDDEGREVPDGQPGEICVRPLAPHILFNGYFGDPEATANAYRGEWFLTGDLARKDPQTGAFFFVDRKKDAVRFGGRNISTLEVESIVLRHPSVREAAAFGVPSEQLASEDELKINVVLHAGQSLSPEALCEFINRNAPYYFVPRYLEFVDALPYTPTNKVQKFELRAAGVTRHSWDRNQSGFKVQKG